MHFQFFKGNETESVELGGASSDATKERIEAAQAHMDALLAEGWQIRLPFLSLERGEDTIDVQFPTREGYAFRGVHVATQADDIRAMLSDFSGELKRLLGEGYRWKKPAWRADMFELAPEFAYSCVDENPGQHHFFVRSTDPKDEFGPEWRVGGELETFGYQVQTQKSGSCLYFIGGLITSIKQYHRHKKVGCSLLFHPDGSLHQVETGTMLATWTGDTLIFNAGPIIEYFVDGKRTKRVERRPGQIKWEIGYHPDGVTVREQGRTNVDNQRFGPWSQYTTAGVLCGVVPHVEHAGRTETHDKENRILCSTWAPGVTRVITWQRLDGTREVEKERDIDGTLVRTSTFSDDGCLLLERALGKDGKWNCVMYGRGGVPEKHRTENEKREPTSEWALVSDFDEVYESKGTNTSPWRLSEKKISLQWIVEALFRCADRGEWLPSPRKREAYQGQVSLTEVSDQLLEHHLARLALLGSQYRIVPRATFGRYVFNHESSGFSWVSAAGSRLTLQLDGGRIVSAKLTTARAGEEATIDGLFSTSYYVRIRIQDAAGRVRQSKFKIAPWAERSDNEFWIERDEKGDIVLASIGWFEPRLHDLKALRSALTFRADRDAAAVHALCVELANGTPSRDRFLELCLGVEYLVRAEYPGCLQIVEILAARVRLWPSSYRCAPHHWILLLVAGVLPPAVLSLADGLSIAAALQMRPGSSPWYPLLIDWCERYPADGPTVSGLVCSFRAEAQQALYSALSCLGASAPPRSDNNLRWLDFDAERVIASTLFRDVRIVDFSLDRLPVDCQPDAVGDHEGRGLCLLNILAALKRTRIEVLNLYGQTTPDAAIELFNDSRPLFDKTVNYPKSGDALNEAEDKFAFAFSDLALRVLNLGGAWPIGERMLSGLLEHGAGLEQIHLGDFVNVSESEFEGSLPGKDTFDQLRKLPALKSYWTDEKRPPVSKKKKVERKQRIGQWEDWFEW